MKCGDFAVHVDFHARSHAVGDDGKSRRIGDRIAGGVRRLRQRHHLVAQLFTRKDQRALLGEECIARRVVAVDVGVDEIADRAAADLAHGRQDLVVELRVLRIDHENAVRPREHADAAAGGILVRRVKPARAGQHVDVRPELFGNDLDLVEVHGLRRRARGKRRHRQSDRQQQCGFHRVSFLVHPRRHEYARWRTGKAWMFWAGESVARTEQRAAGDQKPALTASAPAGRCSCG